MLEPESFFAGWGVIYRGAAVVRTGVVMESMAEKGMERRRERHGEIFNAPSAVLTVVRQNSLYSFSVRKGPNATLEWPIGRTPGWYPGRPM